MLNFFKFLFRLIRATVLFIVGFGLFVLVVIGVIGALKIKNQVEKNQEDQAYYYEQEKKEDQEQDDPQENKPYENTAFTSNQIDALVPCQSKLTSIIHEKKWKNLHRKYFKGRLKANPKTACESYDHREKLKEPAVPDFAKYYGMVYKELAKFDRDKMEPVYQFFEKIKEEKQLDHYEFAEMVVTFIQNLPYVLVHSGTCEQDAAYGGFNQKYHEDGGECLPNIRFGVVSPNEFMYHLKGDCDTRAVLGYLILSHFGYDSAVLIGQTHAMLGVSVPAQGEYLKYKGLKYYFWETTATGYVPGMIAPEYQHERWSIALASPRKGLY